MEVNEVAETIFTNDKKVVCIFSERDWEELIRERIGDDALRYYRNRIAEYEEEIAELKEQIDLDEDADK